MIYRYWLIPEDFLFQKVLFIFPIKLNDENES